MGVSDIMGGGKRGVLGEKKETEKEKDIEIEIEIEIER